MIDFDNFGKLSEKETRKFYNDSKLMNFYFAKSLFDKGIDCHVLCPGMSLITTDINVIKACS